LLLVTGSRHSIAVTTGCNYRAVNTCLQLPVAIAAIPSAPATAPTTAASAVTTAPASAATTMPASPTASAATFALRTSLIHHQRPSHELASIERRNRFFRFRVVADFCEAKAPRLTCETIPKQSERVGLHAGFCKQRRNFFFRCLERQIAHVQFLHGQFLLAPP
jgi:hypothetical protein